MTLLLSHHLKSSSKYDVFDEIFQHREDVCFRKIHVKTMTFSSFQELVRACVWCVSVTLSLGVSLCVVLRSNFYLCENPPVIKKQWMWYPFRSCIWHLTIFILHCVIGCGFQNLHILLKSHRVCTNLVVIFAGIGRLLSSVSTKNSKF